jgi:hypothetical protein
MSVPKASNLLFRSQFLTLSSAGSFACVSLQLSLPLSYARLSLPLYTVQIAAATLEPKFAYLLCIATLCYIARRSWIYLLGALHIFVLIRNYLYRNGRTSLFTLVLLFPLHSLNWFTTPSSCSSSLMKRQRYILTKRRRSVVVYHLTDCCIQRFYWDCRLWAVLSRRDDILISDES